ncbi:hypothetical protein J6590_065624 [Homalodisca vitripennis]|nr:hypothetical protein J6590_065624 [Homalodisca vitripennis]
MAFFYDPIATSSDVWRKVIAISLYGIHKSSLSRSLSDSFTELLHGSSSGVVFVGLFTRLKESN